MRENRDNTKVVVQHQAIILFFWRIRLSRGQHLTGEVKSSDISATDRYMLLSLEAQNTLGIANDPAASTCYFKEFGEYCHVYEERGSGLRAICINYIEEVRQVYTEFAPTVPVANPKLGVKVLQKTPYGKRQCQKLYRRNIGQTSCDNRGSIIVLPTDCTEDLHTLQRTEYAYPLPGPMRDTRKALARMGVVSSSSSDPDEKDEAPASRADHREHPERDDRSYGRVFVNHAEQALGCCPNMRARFLRSPDPR